MNFHTQLDQLIHQLTRIADALESAEPRVVENMEFEMDHENLPDVVDLLKPNYANMIRTAFKL
jgi:hypothetical protein